ncbi:MAG: hypothetical protein KBS99_02195 [Prevotellaceae bacterium]|nr:hypothetical protein [Candidatus Colivivens caballi]
MKKEYKTPTMKVRKMEYSHMLCGSEDGMTINKELGEDYEDDAVAW